MSNNLLTKWFQGSVDAAKCASLRQELLMLVHGQRDIAERLLASEKRRQPNKSERWYLEKVIYDLHRR